MDKVLHRTAAVTQSTIKVFRQWLFAAGIGLVWLSQPALAPLAVAQESSAEAPSPQTQPDAGKIPGKDEFQIAPDTQVETITPLTDAQALESWQLPEGFEMNLFASAPLISQPIAATFDSQGRMWLAENFTYAEDPLRFDRQWNDRVVVLTDSDGDGAADQRQVFWDQAKLLSSVEVGMGGVWLLCPPQMLFIPDANQDAVPDGPPQVVLDGFDDQSVGHNMANGLRWGPDGWLYGRHGIQATSFIGVPGTEFEKRIPINCCIWRYHPVAKKFEIVCHGGTNSWGHDWDKYGELFFINTVIGHLWHAIPGIHGERMYGEDLIPNRYQLAPQVADHVHWDDRQESWSDLRGGVSGGTDAAGGGHAHSGLMIYQGDRWPERFHGDAMTLNFHGRRLNRDRIVRKGATFTATHKDDILRTSDPWFRGIDLMMGPDQAVYILDWSDIGECHENDGVHRSSGRIYRVDYPATETAGSPDPKTELRAALAAFDSSDALAISDFVGSPNPWIARRARLRLQEMALVAETSREHWDQAAEKLRQKLTHDDATKALPAVWALWAMQQFATPETLVSLLDHPSPHVRVWGVRLLSETAGLGINESLSSNGLRLDDLSGEIAKILISRAQQEFDGLVLTYFAASMRLMATEDRWEMAKVLAGDLQFANDPIYPLMIWYGLEPAVVTQKAKVEQWLSASRLPRVDRFVARRLAQAHTAQPGALDDLVAALLDKKLNDRQRYSLLLGITEGLRGWNALDRPARWSELEAAVASFASAAEVDLSAEVGQHEAEPETKDPQALVREATMAFGSNRSLGELLQVLHDPLQPLDVRRPVIQAIARSLNLLSTKNLGPSPSPDPANASPTQEQVDLARAALLQMLEERFLSSTAAEAIGMVNDPSLQAAMLKAFPQTHPNGQTAVINALCQRSGSALMLLNAVKEARIDRQWLSPYLLRQLQMLSDSQIQTMVTQIWPEQSLIEGDRLATIQTLKELLVDDRLANADLQQGRLLFQNQCGKCHRLFGEGERLGPDLTGSQRSNLTFWLQNIVAPSAEVGVGFRMSVVLLSDGRTLSGVVTERTDGAFKLLTQTNQAATAQLIKESDVEAIRETDQSLMPTGLLDGLSDQQKVDLFAYLMMQTAPIEN